MNLEERIRDLERQFMGIGQFPKAVVSMVPPDVAERCRVLTGNGRCRMLTLQRKPMCPYHLEKHQWR